MIKVSLFAIVLVFNFSDLLGQYNIRRVGKNYKRDAFLSFSAGIEWNNSDKLNDWLGSNGLQKLKERSTYYAISIGKKVKGKNLILFEGGSCRSNQAKYLSNNLSFHYSRFFDLGSFRILSGIGIGINKTNIFFENSSQSVLATHFNSDRNYITSYTFYLKPNVKIIKWTNLIYKGKKGKEATEYFGLEFGSRVYAFPSHWVYGTGYRIPEIPEQSLVNPYVSLVYGFW